MSWLNRVPLWGWFVFFLVFCFGVRNPSNYDLASYWLDSNMHLSGRILTMLLTLCVISMVIYETHASFGHKGLILFAAIIGVGFWVLWDNGLFSANSFNYIMWWGPFLLALIMTLGFQGGRIYRNMTSRAPVIVSPDDHDTPQDHPHHA